MSIPQEVSLFPTQPVNIFHPQVGLAVADLLRQMHIQVHLLATPETCGWMAYTAGDHAAAKRQAQAWLLAGQEHKVILIPSPACVQFIRHTFPYLLADDPACAPLLSSLETRVLELTEFLSQLDLPPVRELQGRALLVPPCPSPHLPNLEEMGVGLLTRVPGLTLQSLPYPHCCSWGGTFHLDMPELSNAMMEILVDEIRNRSPEMVIVLEPACHYLLRPYLSRAPHPLPIYHLAEVLAGRLG